MQMINSSQKSSSTLNRRRRLRPETKPTDLLVSVVTQLKCSQSCRSWSRTMMKRVQTCPYASFTTTRSMILWIARYSHSWRSRHRAQTSLNSSPLKAWLSS